MTTSIGSVEDYFQAEIPKGWFEGPVQVRADTEEIVVIGPLAADRPVDAFREETRGQRMTIAGRAQNEFGRRVSWGVEQSDQRIMFSSQSVPVSTRLRFFERTVLDTLVEGGVARSRADALAWCVRLVGRHQEEWLEELRSAISGVERVRDEGPTSV